MTGKVDYKQKYDGLRAKYMNAVDVAFRLGIEEGKRSAEMENLQQQVAEMQEQQAMAAEADMMGGEEEMMPEEMMGEEEMMPEEGMEEEMPEDELGGAIDELEGYVKNEGAGELAELMKSFHKPSKDIKTKAEKENKIGSILKKWDTETEEDESTENTDGGETLGQA